MSIQAAGCILNVPSDRREELLSEYEKRHYIGEPVPKFDHNPKAPLIIFLSFEDKKITHIADGNKWVSGGTDRLRLDMYNLESFDRPVYFDKIKEDFPENLLSHLNKALSKGGFLPPKTFVALVDRIISLDSKIGERLKRFSRKRYEALKRFTPRAKENLALQKETLGLALSIAGIPRDAVLDWYPDDDSSSRSFLEGVSSGHVREDAMLWRDFSIFPGFKYICEHANSSAREFRKDRASHKVTLTVVMANRSSLEEQTGADLIYFNGTYKCFVMVQYKAMEQSRSRRGHTQAEFRWRDDDQFIKEVNTMEETLSELRKISSEKHPDNFRFSENPFFLKFCPRVVFNPDNKGLFDGFYLPLDLWRRLDSAGKLKGPRDGKVLTFRNVERRINNTEFISIVSGAWVGTSAEQSEFLERIVRKVIASGRTVTYALERTAST